MAVYNPGLESKLNSILEILGTTKRSFWPFWEATGQLITCIGPGDLIPAETSGTAEALEDDFSPLVLPCGLHSYHFHPTGDHHLKGIDHASYSFVGAAFSVGAWIRPNAIASNAIIAKYDSVGGVEEYRFWIDGDGKLALELHDASASASEIAVSADVVEIGKIQFVVATFDGVDATPDVRLYVNGAAVNDGATVEDGSYVAMEDTAAPLTIGSGGVTATPTTEFHGRIAMPFITGKELTAIEVAQLYNLMNPMVGLS